MTEVETKPRPVRVKDGISVSAEHALKISEYLRCSVPEKHKMAAQRVLLKQLSPSQAIKQKCLACCNYSREDVKDCGVVVCPLNPYRPYQAGRAECSDESAEEQAGEG